MTKLASIQVRATQNQPAENRHTKTQEKTRRLLKKGLDKLGQRPPELASRARRDFRKMRLAARPQAELAEMLKWSLKELHMGNWMQVANRCCTVAISRLQELTREVSIF